MLGETYLEEDEFDKQFKELDKAFSTHDNESFLLNEVELSLGDIS